MSFFSIQSLGSALAAHLPRAFGGKFCVAFSGGVDSSVLLHALTELRAVNPEWRIRAIHIDHQLQSTSGDWAARCQRVAANLGIELLIERVVVARNDDQGLEAAARNARYAVFRRELQHGEVLLTAHHADDQVETLLLALMRGSGVQGLAAMPPAKPFSRGWHLRPLLNVTRHDLDAWASNKGIDAIMDPSNALLRHDRNYLRHEVLPALRKRWPAVADSIVRSTGHLGEALGLLEELAVSDLKVCAVKRCLNVEALRTLSIARRRNLLRYWLRSRGLPLPSTRKLVGLEHDLFNTDLDRMPCVTWQGAELRWHRGLLYADSSRRAVLSDDVRRQYRQDWHWHESLALPAELGKLSLAPTLGPGLAAARLPAQVSVRYRKGGEQIRLPGRQHRHSLRNLLQESAVLPWWRDYLPLVFVGKQLIAVGDLCISDDFAAVPGEVALQPVWEGAPEWRAVVRDA
jgi:tRNA(Ile)-lysidine synthase